MSVGGVPIVDAVVSVFRPEEGLIDHIATIAPQVRQVIVVDDGSGSSADELLDRLGRLRVRVSRTADNLGIAAALNRGIEIALAEGADHVMTFDQDSRVPAGFVAELLATSTVAEHAGVAVGFVVPERFAGVDQTHGRSRDGFAVARGAIQSGMLVPRATFAKVGLLREELFIDLVDTEFELRVLANELVPVAAIGAELPHELGARYARPPLLGRWRPPLMPTAITLSTPFRYYYRARNRLVVHKLYVRRFPMRMWRDRLIDRLHFADATRFAAPRADLRRILRRAAEDARADRLGRAPADVMKIAAGVHWNADRADAPQRSI